MKRESRKRISVRGLRVAWWLWVIDMLVRLHVYRGCVFHFAVDRACRAMGLEPGR